MGQLHRGHNNRARERYPRLCQDVARRRGNGRRTQFGCNGRAVLISHTGPFEYEARYYNEKAGTEIFFLPQRNDFAPLCIGLDPADNTKIVSDPAMAKPFVLYTPQKYYLIRVQYSEMQLQRETYSIEEAVDPVPHTFGAQELPTAGNRARNISNSISAIPPKAPVTSCVLSRMQ